MKLGLERVPVLLRAEPQGLLPWVGSGDRAHLLVCGLSVLVGAGLFGAAMGCWRSPLQALYTGVKFPLVLFLISIGNGLLNAMLAPLLGLNIGWRQSFMAVLMSFAIASLILGGFSPLLFFLVWNAPPMHESFAAYNLLLVSVVAIIAFAGVASNVRLLQLLEAFGRDSKAGRRVLLAWLAGNLFLGSQLCWILRPFVGSPHLAVQFIRPDAFNGNFYEALLRALLNLFR
jgi:hypothetical protein